MSRTVGESNQHNDNEDKLKKKTSLDEFHSPSSTGNSEN